MTKFSDENPRDIRRTLREIVDLTVEEQSDYAGRPVSVLEVALPIQRRLEQSLVLMSHEKPFELAMYEVRWAFKSNDSEGLKPVLAEVLDRLAARLRNAADEARGLNI